MKFALATALLLIVAACGGSSGGPSAKDIAASKSADAAAAAVASQNAESNAKAAQLKETCDKLGRTWAIPAEEFGRSIIIGLLDSADKAYEAMSSTADQMKIELCGGELYEEVTEFNYEAALARAQLLGCDPNDLDCALKVGEKFTKRAASLLGAAKQASGAS